MGWTSPLAGMYWRGLADCQEHSVRLSLAFVERTLVEHSRRDDPFSALFALSCLEADRAWFLEQGYFHTRKIRAGAQALRPPPGRGFEPRSRLGDSRALPGFNLNQGSPGMNATLNACPAIPA